MHEGAGRMGRPPQPQKKVLSSKRQRQRKGEGTMPTLPGAVRAAMKQNANSNPHNMIQVLRCGQGCILLLPLTTALRGQHSPTPESPSLNLYLYLLAPTTLNPCLPALTLADSLVRPELVCRPERVCPYKRSCRRVWQPGTVETLSRYKNRPATHCPTHLILSTDPSTDPGQAPALLRCYSHEVPTQAEQRVSLPISPPLTLHPQIWRRHSSGPISIPGSTS
jgi:hypothetical protein